MAEIIPKSDTTAEQKLTDCIQSGGIAVAPCDTIYGIVGKAPESEGIIRRVKGRGEDKPFLVLQPRIADVVEATDTVIPDELLDLWPGPLTLVVSTGDGTTGFRVPADPFLRNVLSRTGRIFSTSVNKSGQSALWRIDDIVAGFGNCVELIVDGGDLDGKIASTVLDISTRPYQLLRQGAATLPESIIRLCAE